MGLWIKLKNSFWSHRKTARLKSRLGADALWIPPRLWSYAAESQPDGCFIEYEATEIAQLIGYTGDATSMLQALIESGFLDAGSLELHNWDEHNGYHKIYSDRAKKAATARWSDEKKKAPAPPKRNKIEKEKETSIGQACLKHCLDQGLVGEFPKDFYPVWEEWTAFRLKIKAVKDPKTMFCRQLRDLWTSPKKATEVLNYSIRNGYQGIFLNHENNNKNSRTVRQHGPDRNAGTYNEGRAADYEAKVK